MRMQRREWEATPYAKTDAKDTDLAISKLLDKYKISERQWTEHKGQNGRPAFSLCFIVGGKTYRITVESLDVVGIEPDQLKKQIKRVIYWTLKPLIENSIVFGGEDGMQKLLLPFMVDDTGATVYEQMRPHLANVSAKALISVARRMALPAPGAD